MFSVLRAAVEIMEVNRRQQLLERGFEQLNPLNGQGSGLVDVHPVSPDIVILSPGEFADRRQYFTPCRRDDDYPDLFPGLPILFKQPNVLHDLGHRLLARRLAHLDLDDDIHVVPIAGEKVNGALHVVSVLHPELRFDQA